MNDTWGLIHGPQITIEIHYTLNFPLPPWLNLDVLFWVLFIHSEAVSYTFTSCNVSGCIC
ncbi:hypothetical protein [Yellowstone lake mimivirus]|uniref:hypothetical protein n=1 Tax=Yellowstone lake mimivirus TaxID=1586712 RepID=UPI0006EB470F|nr:hypothetical protein AR680_gp001 [Yellowstone lake mimivirus]BAT21925.1 hypothetical protein [Yellowstone lake mimivirus]